LTAVAGVGIVETSAAGVVAVEGGVDFFVGVELLEGRVDGSLAAAHFAQVAFLERVPLVLLLRILQPVCEASGA